MRTINLADISRVQFFNANGEFLGSATPVDISCMFDGFDQLRMSLECVDLKMRTMSSVAYDVSDISIKVQRQLDSLFGDLERKKATTIKQVKFNDPATIIFWADGSKTVVKCGEKEAYDPEKGLSMALAKKFLGNKGNYYNTFKKWLPENEDCATCDICIDGASGITSNIEAMSNSIDAMAKTLKDIYGNRREFKNE